MAYSIIEPFGEDIANWRAAMIARTLAEINRNHDARSTPFQIDEFMPISKPIEVEAQPWEVLLDKAKAITAALGGLDGTGV